MPTILFIYGWRLFFYSNEGTEPMHVHAEKGDMECKFWLLVDEIELFECIYLRDQRKSAGNILPHATFKPFPSS